MFIVDRIMLTPLPHGPISLALNELTVLYGAMA